MNCKMCGKKLKKQNKTGVCSKCGNVRVYELIKKGVLKC